MKSKNKRLISIFIVLLFILMALTSCTQNTASKAEYVDDAEDDSPLKVYLLDWDNFEKKSISRFNSLVAIDDIAGRKIEITEIISEQKDEMYKMITTEMMAGGGPDIIFTNLHFCSKNDFVKMTQQNSFADMDILANNSDTFNFDDYNKMVLDAGIINGTRTLMPYSYYVPYAFTTKEVLEENNIELPENMTYEELYRIIQDYSESSPKNFYRISDFMLYEIFSLNNPTLNWDDDIVRLYFKRVRELLEEGIKYSDGYNNTPKGEDLLFFDYKYYDFNQFSGFLDYYNRTNNENDNNIDIFKMPCDKGGNTKAYINQSVAININSKHKNDAFKFVEYMMSYNVAIGKDYEDTQYNRISLPVNNKAYEEYKKVFITELYSPHIYETFTPRVIPEALADKYIEILESPVSCEFNGQALYFIFSDILQPMYDFFQQKTDYDTMVEQINNKYDIYESE